VKGALLLSLSLLGGCGHDPSTPARDASSANEPPSFPLTSPAFAHGAAIPTRFTADGADLSPALRWQAPPAGTVELALVCHDPDAPRAEGWTHWVLTGIPPSTRSLPEGLDAAEHPSAVAGATSGKNDFGRLGYGGPSPPPGHGVHHYHFFLYALDRPSGAPVGVTRQQLDRRIRGHVVGRAELVGTYERHGSARPGP